MPYGFGLSSEDPQGLQGCVLPMLGLLFQDGDDRMLYTYHLKKARSLALHTKRQLVFKMADDGISLMACESTGFSFHVSWFDGIFLLLYKLQDKQVTFLFPCFLSLLMAGSPRVRNSSDSLGRRSAVCRPRMFEMHGKQP